jgi:ABC-type lipoprotein release transport system permease subunit
MSNLSVTGSSTPLQNMNMPPITAGEVIKIAFKQPAFSGIIVITSTLVGMVLGLSAAIKVKQQANRFSEETQNATWFKPSLKTLELLAGLVPVIGIHMATMKFLPISLSPKASFIVASTTLITISTIMAGLMYCLDKR